MTEIHSPGTPDEKVAERIVSRFVATGLLPAQFAPALQAQLAEGKLSTEDWRLWAEKAIDQTTRGEGDER